MKLRVFVNPSRLRWWHIQLARQLTLSGHDVSFAFAEGGPTLSSMLDVLLRVERRIYRLQGRRPSQRIAFNEISPFLGQMDFPNLVIDLTVIGAGKGQAEACNAPILNLLFDDDPSEAAAVSAVLAGRGVMLTVVDGAGAIVAAARPAIEKPYVLGKTLDDIFGRAILALCKAVAGHAVVRPAALADTEGVRPTAPAIAWFGLSSFLQRLAVANRLKARENGHWRIGWRRLGGTERSISEIGRWSAEGHCWLPDDGQRYFADPFLFEHEGKTIVFCEEVPASTGKGVISCFTIDADGKPGAVTTVLERPYHLSYPFVFEHDGEIFMIPETLANRTVELYRAERFPDRWVLDTVLLSDVAASDATIIRHNGRFWLFATEEQGGSSWDCLSVWHAGRLRGPWLPHPMNPVLIDASSARPAGPSIRCDGLLLRPAQDCSRVYGGGVVVKQITRLDTDAFEEQEHTVDGVPCRVSGIHTVGQSAGWQSVDMLDGRRGAGVEQTSGLRQKIVG